MMEHVSFGRLWRPVLEPIVVGAVPLGIVFGLLFYVLTRWGMSAFREQRRRRIEERSASRRAAAPPQGHGIGTAAR
jgi:uncharacterized protein (DUF2062 family)